MKNFKAFSLIEVIVVFGIISVILGLTTAYFFNYKAGAALKISANNIMGALNQARSLAITSRVEHGVAFDVINNQYFVFKKENQSTRQIVTQNLKTSSGVVIESTNLPIDSHAAINKRAAVFNITGGAENNASIFLENSHGKYYTLTLINTTGRIRIYNYQKL